MKAKGKLSISKSGTNILDSENYVVADCFGNTTGNAKATAKELIRRWNNFDGLLEESKKAVDWFDKISRYQNQRLGHGLEEACQTWGEASDVEIFDFTKMKAAIAKTKP